MRPAKSYYTDEERKRILDYIIENEGYYNLRGNSFWKQMESDRILHRTWQSMKEHFRMKIVNNLYSYNLSKEQRKKILSGYNQTKISDRDGVTSYKSIEKFDDDIIDFSDEETTPKRSRSLSTSSDESLDLVNDLGPSTSKKAFRKQPTRRNDNPPINVAENEPMQLDFIDLSEDSSPLPDNSPVLSCNVSSTNVHEACTEFSVADDTMFLKAITKYESNLLNCGCVVTFIKQYVDYYNNCRNWTELYDRFLEILNNLQLYDFLSPGIVAKLQQIKEPLEKYRSNGFQDIQHEIITVHIRQGMYKVTTTPDPSVVYLTPEQMALFKALQDKKRILQAVTEDVISGEMPKDSIGGILKAICDFRAKYAPPSPTDESSVEDDSLTDAENQLDLSDAISIQSKIAVNLSEIENQSANSEYLEPLSSDDVNAINVIGRIIQNDLNKDDIAVLTDNTK